MSVIARSMASTVAALVAVSLVLVACNDRDSGAGPTPDAAAARAVVERFFHWYVSERNLGRDPMGAPPSVPLVT